MLGNESILAVDYRVDGDILYRYHAKVVERIVPWGAAAAAWRMAGGEWQAFTPKIHVPSIEEIVLHPGGVRLPGWLRRVAACRFLMERWPQEVRDAVRGFGSAHWQLLQFLNHGGAAAFELLQSNAALGYLAAIAGSSGQLGLRRRSLAATFGFPETEHAVRLLRKVPIAWISAEFLAELRAVMTHEQEADAVIRHLGCVTPIVLEVARDPVLRASVTADCMARLTRVPAAAAHCDLTARMRDLVESARCRGERAPRFRQLADLDRPVSGRIADAPAVQQVSDRQVALGGFPVAPPRCGAVPETLPPPPVQAIATPCVPGGVGDWPSVRRNPDAFPAPPLRDVDLPGIRIVAIRSRGDLVAESDAMNHCAGKSRSFARRVMGERLYFYRMFEPERLTIAIRPRWNKWVVEEVRGICNRSPFDSTMFLIENWLQSRGSVEAAECVRTVVASAAPVVLRQAVPRRRRGATSADQLSFGFAERS